MCTPSHLGRMCHTCMGALCKRHQAGLNTYIGRQTWMTTCSPLSTHPRTPTCMNAGCSGIHGSSWKGRWDVESRWSLQPPHRMRHPHPRATPRKKGSGAPDWISAVRRHQIAYNLNGPLTPCPATPCLDCRNDLVYGRILGSSPNSMIHTAGCVSAMSRLQCGKRPQRDGPNPPSRPW